MVGLLSVGSLVVRFFRARGVEQQQIKWVAFAAMFFISWAVLAQFLPDVFILSIVDEVLFIASLQGLWIATGVAVLRYRLYDVDVVVNRALVYTVLTTLLVIIYFGSVAAFQLLLRPLPGDESQLAVVASTLALGSVQSPASSDTGFYRPALLQTQVRREKDPRRLLRQVARRDGPRPAGRRAGLGGRGDGPAGARLAVAEAAASPPRTARKWVEWCMRSS